MPIENNIEPSSGQIYFKGIDGLSEPIDISEGEIVCEDEWADDKEYIKINSAKEATFECDLQINREWTLVYCRNCRRPFPIIQFNAMIYGTDGWSCPLCTTIARMKERSKRHG